MSSGGPSSPNISDSLNSRSDFSISLASNDGGLLASVTEFSQMFQRLDDDLGSVGTQFTFDHFRQQSEEKRTANNSTCGDGLVDADSVLETYDVSLDDEEDEPTIYNDSVITIDDESQRTIQMASLNVLKKKSPGDPDLTKTEIVSNNTNLDSVKPNEELNQETEQVSRIKKQISLYERENSMEFRKLSHDVEKFTRRPGSEHMAKRWIDSTQQTNHVSADNLSNTSFYIGRSPIQDSKPESHSPKTMSCMNLKSCAGPSSVSPGAVLVREKFIELPLRVAKSFHGNTSFLKYKCKKSKKMDAGVSTESVFTVPASSDIKHRFVTTKVNEFNIDLDKVGLDADECDDES